MGRISEYYAKVNTFWSNVNIADEKKVTYLLEMFRQGVVQSDSDQLEFVVDLAFKIENQQVRILALNHLLLLDGHDQHQMITRELQNLAHSSSVAIIAKIFEQDFKRFAYTASDDGVIAKWFSHALADIGTEDALALLKLYAQSENEAIAQEMQYRLRRIAKQQEMRQIRRPEMNVVKRLVNALKNYK